MPEHIRGSAQRMVNLHKILTKKDKIILDIKKIVVSLIYQTTKTGTGYPNTIYYEKVISVINGTDVICFLWTS